jgi:hypothetical protein
MKYKPLGMPCQDFDTVICLVVQSNVKIVNLHITRVKNRKKKILQSDKTKLADFAIR